MTWAQRLKRVFGMPEGTLSGCCASIHLFDVKTSPDRGGVLDVVACVEEPLFIGRILGHDGRREKFTGSQARASPGCSQVATGPRYLPIGNFCARTKVKYYTVTNISMSSRLCDR